MKFKARFIYQHDCKVDIYEIFDCPIEEYNGRRGYLWHEKQAEGYCLLGDEECNKYHWSQWKLLEPYWITEEIASFGSKDSSQNEDEKFAFSVTDYGFGNIFENAQPELNSKLKQFVDDWIVNPSKLVFLSGSTGLGKTLICCYIMRKLYALNTDFEAGDIRHYLEDLYTSQKEENCYYPILNSWKNTQVFILDDFGSCKVTDWRIEVLLDLIDHRWANEKPTFITSNISIDQIRDLFGQRLASRLGSGMIINLKGKDRRLN